VVRPENFAAYSASILAKAKSGFSLLARLETIMEETVPMIFSLMNVGKNS
jgi:hypothetical protein